MLQSILGEGAGLGVETTVAPAGKFENAGRKMESCEGDGLACPDGGAGEYSIDISLGSIAELGDRLAGAAGGAGDGLAGDELEAVRKLEKRHEGCLEKGCL